MEQTMTQEIASKETKIVIKKTIPNKQKTTIKLIMWALSRVLDKEATTAKVVELFKLGESIETIIEMVDEIENSAEYAQMETNLTDIRTSFKPAPASRKKNVATEKVSGDPDTIIKQLVEMAINESKPATVKKPRAPKKVAVKEVAPEVITTEVISETAGKKPRAPKKAGVKEVAPEVISESVIISEATVKKPRASKKAAVVEAPPVAVSDDLCEEEYLILNEVECDGTTYLVDSEQNIVDEFNAVIGKYENGKATLV